ncbi:MAG: FtsX-like permease family protein [Gemmataceae bacterium]|nr:FtsX-like permease family protein [Gemmataceae bacterium]
MYKFLLCLRYLRTRYLAFVCIVSVMLGVATLIVVNSVMAGFSTKLKDRFRGLHTDVTIESPNMNGFSTPAAELKEKILNSRAGEFIEAMTETVEVFGMATFELYLQSGGSEPITMPVQVIGIDPEARAKLGGFAQYLTTPSRREKPSFELDPKALARWHHLHPPVDIPEHKPLIPGAPPLPDPPRDPVKPMGCFPGFAITHYRSTDPVTGAVNHKPLLLMGDSIRIVTASATKRLEPVYADFAIADSIQTEIPEYDRGFFWVKLEDLQTIRGMPGRCSHIHIRLKDYSKNKEAVEALREIFPDEREAIVQTWEDKNRTLLDAIDTERGILNLLLFMIVGVAGFSVLAVFSMIVREKTRDIGILKSLGASDRGVMSIFLGYGLLLGGLGAGLGIALGLTIVHYINPIEQFLSKNTGVGFDRRVYYFEELPTHVQPEMVALVTIGALLISVLFSVLPALRAAMLKPVRALRYE